MPLNVILKNKNCAVKKFEFIYLSILQIEDLDIQFLLS